MASYLLPINDLIESIEDFKDLVSLKQDIDQSSKIVK